MRTTRQISHRALALGLTAALAATALACASVPRRSRAEEPDPPASADRKAAVPVETDLPGLIAAHNRFRADEKLPPLQVEPRLTRAARLHALDMAEHEKMAHEGSDGSTPAERITRQGYPSQNTGENVATGQRTSAEVMDAWMHSSGHRKNILGDFTEIGVARSVGPDGAPYWAVVFGRPWPQLDPERATAGVLAALNAHREKEGLPPLTKDPTLAAVARRHAEDNAARGKLDLEDRDGVKPLDRVKASGYRFRSVGLADAAGNPNAEAVVASWMDNARIRTNLLGPFTDAGIGYARAADGMPYWCLILGSPLR